MATTIKKGKIGKEDVNFYTAASPTFARITSSGGSTTLTAVSATNIPLIQSSGSLYWSANNVQRALNEGISRYFSNNHSIATFTAGAKVGDHKTVYGYRNAIAATSIQAAASNAFLANGIAVVVIPEGTYTVSTPIQLPRRSFVIGAGKRTTIRAGSTTQVSRLFSISGTSGATSQAVSAPVEINATTLTVTNGAQYVSGNWIDFTNYPKREYFKINSIAGNVLTISRPTGFRYTAGTVKVIYPAELYLDKMQLTLTSSTQGIGVAATYMMQSRLGNELYIGGAAEAAVKLTRSYGNILDMNVEPSKKAVASTGQPYGVWVTDASQDNVFAGTRDGRQRDVADGRSMGNFVFGSRFGDIVTLASGPSNPTEKLYRSNKPELSYVTYASTVAVACVASATIPAEVFINGRIFKNTGTVISDLSRTITPANATIGGMDRGPVTATRAIYMYAVPSQNSSATRQWDLMGSTGAPNNTMTASATFPAWSFLGAVITGATLRVIRFAQNQDHFSLWDNSTGNIAALTSPISAMATWRQVRLSAFPIGIKSIDLENIVAWNALAVDAAFNGFIFYMGHGDATNINQYYSQTELSRAQDAGSAAQTRPIKTQYVRNLPVNSGRFAAYRADTAATANVTLRFRGFTLPRDQFK